MNQIPVVLESYNKEALERGLGVKLSDLSEEQLTKILSHALGYVDYTNESIANELKEIAEIKEPKPFYTLYQEGEVSFDKIHDYIDEWHKGTSEKELHDYLGFTWEQYSKFVEDENSFEAMLKSQKND